MPWPTVRVGDEGARVSSVTVDSGAAASVPPASAFAEAAQLEPQAGLCFLSANGEVVPELYRAKPVVMTEKGSLRITDFSVASVHKVALMSPAQVANRRAGLRRSALERGRGSINAKGSLCKTEKPDETHTRR